MPATGRTHWGLRNYMSGDIRHLGGGKWKVAVIERNEGVFGSALEAWRAANASVVFQGALSKTSGYNQLREAAQAEHDGRGKSARPVRDPRASKAPQFQFSGVSLDDRYGAMTQGINWLDSALHDLLRLRRDFERANQITTRDGDLSAPFYRDLLAEVEALTQKTKQRKQQVEAERDRLEAKIRQRMAHGRGGGYDAGPRR